MKLFGLGTQNQQYRLALLIFLFFHVGLVLELLLIGHYDSFWQYFPLISLGLGVISILPVVKSLVIVKLFYLVTILTGVLGVFLHLKSNWEFILEVYQDIECYKLISKSFTGAIPALAPGTLIPIGLLGFLLLHLKPKKPI